MTKEERKEYNKQYHLANIERKKEYGKQWRLANPEYMKQYIKQWDINNPKYSKEYYRNNKHKWTYDLVKYNKFKELIFEGALKKSKCIEPGVYMIKNQITGERYIGSSKRPYRRRSDHFSIQTGRITTNENMQIDLKQYGKLAFVFGILEHCELEQLLEREQYYINLLNPEYNVKQNM
jgi:hypothetical protein